MERLLSLSRAAKLAGVSRGEIQQRIQAGVLPTFEGSVKLKDLIGVYPDVEVENSGMIERTARIRANAQHKYQAEYRPKEALLVDEVNRLRIQLDEANAKVEHYEEMVSSLKDRIQVVQQQCGHQQKAMLQAMVRWMLTGIERWG